MEELDDMYLMFTADELRFLMPLGRVLKVVEQSADTGQLPVLNFAELISGHRSVNGKGYIILTESGEEQFGLSVENVEGICRAETGQTFSLPRAVKSESNNYLRAVVSVGDASDLAYILDPSVWEKKNGARRERAWTL